MATRTTAGPPRRLGFVINPIAGMGGRVGFKGTDGMAEEARARGAEEVAPGKAALMLAELHRLLTEYDEPPALEWLTAASELGEDSLRRAGFDEIQVCRERAADRSTADDTRAACREFVDAGAEIVVFCGGDGTARDVAAACEGRAVLLGVPAGVKMYSGVFAVHARAAAHLLLAFLQGNTTIDDVDVLDLDEQAYREDEWSVRLFDVVRTPHEHGLRQQSKVLIEDAPDEVAKQEIAAGVAEQLMALDAMGEDDLLVLLGAGSTVAALGRVLGAEGGTLLGVDAWAGGELVGRDLDERGILALLDRYPSRRLALSPIGAAGFVLGRGNQQLSATVLERLGPRSLIVLATPAKLRATGVLRFDSGDDAVDRRFHGSGFLPVVCGERVRRLVPIETFAASHPDTGYGRGTEDLARGGRKG